MRIGIDGRVLDRKITGTGRYLQNLLLELPNNHDDKNDYILFTNTKQSFDSKFFTIVNVKESFIPMKLYSPIWFNYELPKLLKEYSIDILLAPNIIVPLVDIGKTKIITVVHDIIPRIFPEYYPYFYKKYLSIFLPPTLKKADIIITVSEQSKEDLVDYYNVPEEKLRIVYNSSATIFNTSYSKEVVKKMLEEKLSIKQEYLLYVGVIDKRKNVLGLIKILDLIKKQESKLILVVVGEAGYISKEFFEEINKRKDIIKHFNYVDDETLTLLYSNAFAFLFPSYYEGFGIPPLEAMQSGIPVLSSNKSSLKEVVGHGGLIHDPDNHSAFANDILKLENDSDFYNGVIKKGLEQSRKFDIKKMASRLVNIINEIQLDK
ncbi:MAG: glycosyltransferase family 4 protein [Melioribacteraceae bacterium]|nr:glycosyltransferase family 4 protein [Melioribacteraceae bacterium]